MAVQKKTPTAVSSAPVPAPAPAATSSKKKDVPAPKPVVAPAPAPAPVVEKAPEVVDTVSESSSLEDLGSKLTALASLLKETQVAFKTLTKEYERMKKVISKTERKRANARTNPNGFAKPTKITDVLCNFLGVPSGTEVSRTDVTRKINQYIKEHNLNKPENKRIILPDEKLSVILGVKPAEEVSFFHLQRHLSPLFVKKEVVAK